MSYHVLSLIILNLVVFFLVGELIPRLKKFELLNSKITILKNVACILNKVTSIYIFYFI